MKREEVAGLLLVLLSLFSSAMYVLSLPEPELESTNLATSYWHRYVVQHYKPRLINPEEIGDYPPEYFIEDIPWISYGKAYCASTCLQMIAYRYGFREPVEYFNIIMGFTCGAYLNKIGERVFFIPGSDPLAGLARASKYLGLEYRMLVTADRDLFFSAVRYLLSKNIPLILPVNSSRMYGLGGFSPHFVLAIGYTSDKIYVYEPVMMEEDIRYGERGIGVKNDVLAKAVTEMIRGMGYPVDWNYALVYYVPGGGVEKDLRKALRDCGELQLGTWFAGTTSGVYTGAYAFRELANVVEKGSIDLEILVQGLMMTITSRRDNAGFLRSAFPEDPNALKIADALEKVADICKEVIEILKTGYTEENRRRVAEKLREAADHEREAGYLMITLSQ